MNKGTPEASVEPEDEGGDDRGREMGSVWDGARMYAAELIGIARKAMADNAAHASASWDKAAEGDYDVGAIIEDVTVYWERAARDTARAMVATAGFLKTVLGKRDDS